LVDEQLAPISFEGHFTGNRYAGPSASHPSLIIYS
jgi:hypothetical protein